MTSLLDLPPEIIQGIFTLADQPSRKQLRLTSAFLGAIGQPYVFQTIRIKPGKESQEKFKNILSRPHLSSSVAKVWLDAIVSDDGSVEATEYFDSWQRDVVAKLHDLPRLQSVVLHFEDSIEEEVLETEIAWLDWTSRHTMHTCSYLFEKVMPTLASLPGLTELGIKELQNIAITDPSVTEDLRQVLGRLRSLRLNVAHEHTRHYDDDIDLEQVHVFFTTLPLCWLKPTTANLEHLTLYSTLYFGFYPKCDHSATTPSPTTINYPGSSRMAQPSRKST
ncbi:uncharacterized protein DSM5745_09633 [Aspergillus mulundensis]|uniref:F-box domain-containing protein n=1 Tax=Aspergillus mulundensis TaxID=1810919 RepID=A0A3D8QWI9_9EURO|nr:hypothetical protein DSM5745_09633 [Aspergillus mulundensis]RDW65894.1 hypothetical protein DSM5745_09633 [Aspergillus mulundensis]